jgi:hypothetical protein
MKFLSRKIPIIVLILCFAAVGAILIFTTHAATPFVAAEPENGSLTSPASIVTDSSASNTKAVKFGSSSTGGGCVGAANTPGGADPWGGCWPGPQNTGVPAGTTLKRVPQDVTSGTGWHWSAGDGAVRIDSCNAVIDSVDINGGILMRVGNGTTSPETPCATARKSIIRGVVYVDDSGCTGECGPIVVRDSEVIQTGRTNYSNLMIFNFWMYNVNSHGGRGPSCNGACGIIDSWIHGLYLEGAVHHNAAGTNGVGNGPFTIQHNFLNCADFSAVDPDTTTGAGCSADIGLYGDFADLKNITITRNYLAPALTGGSNLSYAQPGYCFQTGMNVSKPYNKPSNLIVRENIFAKGATGKCGTFGPHSGWDGAVRGNVWEGNKWDDGSTLNP